MNKYRVSQGSKKIGCETLQDARQERAKLAAGLPEDSIIDIEKLESGYAGGEQWIVQDL